jgi:hypothetical protein
MNYYPVLRFLNHATAIEQIALAKSHGAAGIFFEDHASAVALGKDLALAKTLSADFPIGVKLTPQSPQDIAQSVAAPGFDMVWLDGAVCENCDAATIESLRSNETVRTFASLQGDGMIPKARSLAAAGLIAAVGPEHFMSESSDALVAALSVATGGEFAIVSSSADFARLASICDYIGHALIVRGVMTDDYHLHPAKLQALQDVLSAEAPA